MPLKVPVFITSKVSVRPRAALATIPKRGTEDIASDVALTTLRPLMMTARVSPEEGFLTVRTRMIMISYG